MALDRPFMINLYWDDNNECHNGFVKGIQTTFTTSIVFRHKMGFQEFLHLVWSHVGVRKSVKLKISMSYHFQGIANTVLIISDQSLDTLYYLAERDENFWGHVHVEFEKITHETPQDSKSVDNRSCIVSESFVENSYGFMELCESHDELPNNMYATSSEFLIGSPCIDFTIAHSFPLVGDDKFQVEDNFEFDFSEIFVQHNSPAGELDVIDDAGDTQDDEKTDCEDNAHVDVWRESQNQIRVGMLFATKSQVQKAVTLWSITQNREFKVVESKSTKWIAKCNKGGGGGGGGSQTNNCKWYVRAVKKKSHNMWQITRWVDTHSCFGSSITNKIRNLNSKTIAAYILHSIRKDISYPIKSIQQDIKTSLNVDVSYWKAWHGRRKAIDSLRNFEE